MKDNKTMFKPLSVGVACSTATDKKLDTRHYKRQSAYLPAVMFHKKIKPQVYLKGNNLACKPSRQTKKYKGKEALEGKY